VIYVTYKKYYILKNTVQHNKPLVRHRIMQIWQPATCHNCYCDVHHKRNWDTHKAEKADEHRRSLVRPLSLSNDVTMTSRWRQRPFVEKHYTHFQQAYVKKWQLFKQNLVKNRVWKIWRCLWRWLPVL